jgi:hypothetical protein
VSVAEAAHRPANSGRAVALWLAFILIIGFAVALAWKGAGALRPEVTSSGLQFRTLKAGKGKNINGADAALLDYVLSANDGQSYDSSESHGGPQPFTTSNVYPGFAEAMSRPGLADTLQREFRVTIAGPTTLQALLNSFQLGFRTLAVQKRSTEVWRVLGAVKTEFDRFGALLAKTKDKLVQVSNTLDEAGKKSTTIARKLRDVEALPEDEADRLLTGEAGRVIDVEDDVEPLALALPPDPVT